MFNIIYIYLYVEDKKEVGTGKERKKVVLI